MKPRSSSQQSNGFPCGLTRREWIGNMGGGFTGTALAAMLAQSGFPNSTNADESQSRPQPHFAPKAERVIFLMMNGAPSQVDTFDYKPELKKYAGKELP
ncbi:MAG: DUF1501 domain-containing protein, partial [Planctomycetota bacterium]|nr:DUF1501 domain-containing protein [Planctomycetota bacterium]